ncbi:uncharacterized protein LOC127079565 [Lathyrus oleraceus]|uniref:uncharacterized protein LOC127079565 n=1 Tax=Pisum sativum TaxID=3888 RepID=UPI0021D1204D|nr:uncharacterized protein LOC127079565 [Pisum sativum]
MELFDPCVIYKFFIDKALCDLGASVSLMPLLIYERLNLGDLKPAKIFIQLVGRLVNYPVGIAKDILVRIGQLYIPTYFVVIDIKEDSNIPILSSRHFLATISVIIDVKRRKLTFEVGQEKIEFILSQFIKAFSIDDMCFFMDIIDECLKELSLEAPPT